MKPVTAYIVLTAIVTPIATVVGYTLWWAFKQRHMPHTVMNPAEAWIAARWHRKELDRELSIILGPTESR